MLTPVEFKDLPLSPAETLLDVSLERGSRVLARWRRWCSRRAMNAVSCTYYLKADCYHEAMKQPTRSRCLSAYLVTSSWRNYSLELQREASSRLASPRRIRNIWLSREIVSEERTVVGM